MTSHERSKKLIKPIPVAELALVVDAELAAVLAAVAGLPLPVLELPVPLLPAKSVVGVAGLPKRPLVNPTPTWAMLRAKSPQTLPVRYL